MNRIIQQSQCHSKYTLLNRFFITDLSSKRFNIVIKTMINQYNFNLKCINAVLNGFMNCVF